MTETKFTPGLWEARYSSVIDVEKDEIIAVMTCGSVYRKNELEDYDTARFIAAAPIMYAALDELADLMQGVIDGDYKPDSFTLQVARAALAEARGEA